MPSPTGPSLPPPLDADLDVRGTIPQGLSGRLLGIGRDGVIHSVLLGADRAVSFRAQRVGTDAGLHQVVAFGGSILAFGDDTPAHELSADLGAMARVDLAGSSRSVEPFPMRDRESGDLHLVARNADGAQAHVVVAAGAFTRRSRSIPDAPRRITDLALTRDRVVFVADGVVGVAPRDGELRMEWIATGAAAPHLLHARDDGDTVMVLALTPALEQWTLHVDAGTVRREVLDATPRRFAHLNDGGVDDAPRRLWTTGGWTVGSHDLAAHRHTHHDLHPHEPGDLVFVPDPGRSVEADGGWLVGFVHDTGGASTELSVVDAADIAGPAIATAHIPTRVPSGLRCTWIPRQRPNTHHTSQGDRP